ncbi:MAG: hypothetical protein IPK79_02480 [Vampirovibrionales bacterium]|nr:hypothetical protein [Vampirovibrionales bacterium]
MMNHTALRLALSLLMSASLAAMALAQAPPAAAPPKTVAGKVVKVAHQKVKVGAQWLDQISVTVDACATPAQQATVVYSPATVSDRTALGHLFEENLQSALSPDMKQQQMPNGYALFWVDANNIVQRTGILGSKVDCNAVPSLIQQFN